MTFDPSLPRDGANVSRTHPLREAALLVAVVAAGGALCVIAIATAVDWLVPRLPPGLEVRLFENAWPARAEAGAEVARAEAAQRLLRRLALHWSDNPYPLRLGVWRESQPNAFALPGGAVVVTSGLLARVESENELAFVLGHELGHFQHRDHLRGLGRGLAFALVVSALGAGAGSELAEVAGQLAQRGFDRDQERAADGFGLELVAAEYGHVAGSEDFFRRLPQPDGALEEALAGYVATHPLHQERLEALRALAAERGWSTRGTLQPIAD